MNEKKRTELMMERVNLSRLRDALQVSDVISLRELPKHPVEFDMSFRRALKMDLALVVQKYIEDIDVALGLEKI